jgi:multidrug efflux system membrane fusion protein
MAWERVSGFAKTRNGRRWVIAIGIILAALLVYWLVQVLKPKPKPKPPPAVPVDIATAKLADVPVYVEGLGTVQAFYTVTVTARVDGQIESVDFVEGQEVRKGAVLAQIDPRPLQAALDQAKAAAAKDNATLINARRDLERYELLAPEELASKQTVDTQHSLVAQLDAQVRGDEANVASAQTQLDYARITSPINGRTGIRLVDPGNNVHASGTSGIVVVTQLQPISIIFSLPEDALKQVSDAVNRGSVAAVALSRNRREELDRGTVALIDNQIDQATGTIKIKATFPNASRTLWPGEFVNVKILTDVLHNAVTIPASALQRGPNGVFTYVVQQDSSVEPVTLTVGEQDGDNVVVEKGVNAGAQVVASNQYRLQPKAHVRANASTATATPVPVAEKQSAP